MTNASRFIGRYKALHQNIPLIVSLTVTAVIIYRKKKVSGYIPGTITKHAMKNQA